MRLLESKWQDIKRALTLTVHLAANFGFKTETLGADSALLPIAYYLYAIDADDGYLTKAQFNADRETIRRWLISSLLKSGIWGSGLDSSLTVLRQVIRDDHDNGFPVERLYDAMRARGKSLTFNDEEIEELTDMRYGDRRTFSLLSLVFRHLDLRNYFHIDHFFPKSRFTPARLTAQGFLEEDVASLREMADSLPNLQLLAGAENQEKRAMLPADWLANFESDEKRSEYVNLHLLGEVPDNLSGFGAFFAMRRERLKTEIRMLLMRADETIGDSDARI